jgi:hypothetical protein
MSPAASSNHRYKTWIRSFGVPIRIESNSEALLCESLEAARIALCGNIETISEIRTKHFFKLTRESGDYVLEHSAGPTSRNPDKERILKFFDSMIRIEVAEYAENRVFLHAGVVGWKGKAIVYPADSFGGKSTLTAEFVKLGAEYFSDDFAVIDEFGMVHPYPRLLSLRSRPVPFEPYQQAEVAAESLGGLTAARPLPVGALIITRFDEKAVWNPVLLTPGEAVIEVISQTIPIRYAPEFSLNVLKKITTSAILLKCPRNEAREFARLFLDFVDNKAF